MCSLWRQPWRQRLGEASPPLRGHWLQPTLGRFSYPCLHPFSAQASPALCEESFARRPRCPTLRHFGGPEISSLQPHLLRQSLRWREAVRFLHLRFTAHPDLRFLDFAKHKACTTCIHSVKCILCFMIFIFTDPTTCMSHRTPV